MDNVSKFYWVVNHPNLCKFRQAQIEMTPHMVNPLNDTIEEDVSLNSKQQWWIEVSHYEDTQDEMSTHDWELDCGGDSAEEAVAVLYKLVLEHYGDY